MSNNTTAQATANNSTSGVAGTNTSSSRSNGTSRSIQQHTSLPSRIIRIITLIIRLALYPLRLVTNILFPPHEFDGLSQSADKSAAYFSRTYFPLSSNTENNDRDSASGIFSRAGYVATVTEAQRRSQICLIYLHSPLHRDAEHFLNRTLRANAVESFLASAQTRLACYANSIHTADGAHAAQTLSVSSYPFVAVLGLKRDSGNGGATRAEVVLRMEGIGQMESEEFLSRVRAAVESQEEVLREVERRRRIREEEIRLREEQDREFQQTLLADQRREAERQREEHARETAVLNAQRAKQSKLDAARALLKPEPSTNGAEKTARLRLTLPTGKKIDRRFLAEDKIEHVRAFLTINFEENDVGIENFSLSSSYPKKVFEDGSISLEEAGLCPMAVLMVQDLDA